MLFCSLMLTRRISKEQNIILQSNTKVVLHFVHFIQCSHLSDFLSHFLLIFFIFFCSLVFSLKGKKKGVFWSIMMKMMDSLCQGVHEGLLVATR